MHMAIATDNKLWTATELRAIPDERNRYEIIDGELFVTPAPALRHQALLMRLLRAIDPYVETHQLGYAMVSPADVELAADTVVQPDLFVITRLEGERPRSWSEIGPLLLAIEILSPRTAHVDRTVKRRRYQLAGIPEYWIVDGDARVVERWRPQDERPEIMSERLEWQPEPTLQALVIDLPALFKQALGA